MRDQIKWWLFPGLNLHARLRNKVLPRYFGRSTGGEVRDVLDAGCGNGMLAYQSYLRGNRVLGISIKEGEIERNKRLFHGKLGVPQDRLDFRVHNIYELDKIDRKFDEIICTEVLEHIADDDNVCRSFLNALKPGGVLHLCCPNADHPDHAAMHLDEDESGGHVRAGYTDRTYRDLLGGVGFDVAEVVGLGGSIRQSINKRITGAQRGGFMPGLALFLVTWPLHNLDGERANPPYSLYVRAVKPVTARTNAQEVATADEPAMASQAR